MADKKALPQRLVEQERARKDPEEWGEPYEYESDMVKDSMMEQGKRAQAKRAKDPESRKYLLKDAADYHSKMTDEATWGLASRYAKKHPQKRAAKRN